MAPRSRLPLLAAVVPYAALSAAYSFNFKNSPRQCQDLQIEITGAGSPPYSVLIVPIGPSPLPAPIEARRITEVSFNGTSTTASFQLKFPESSNFVAVVSTWRADSVGEAGQDGASREDVMMDVQGGESGDDEARIVPQQGSLRHSPSSPPFNVVRKEGLDILTPSASEPIDMRTSFTEAMMHTSGSYGSSVSDSTGFGSGGTSAAVTVLSGVDGCFDATKSVSPAFIFHTEPSGALTTCSTSRIWWDPNDVQGQTTFHGVIPGGKSFEVPQGPLTNVTGQGTGFSWTPSVPIGTTVLLVGGDDRGIGSAGSGSFTMQEGTTQSCINSSSPSSTPGSPAGGSYPTSTDGSGINTGSGEGSHSHVGAIVGGVVGGIFGALAIALVIFSAVRRRRLQQGTKERPVDLLQEQDNEGAGDGRPPEYYRPEPFVLPDPTVASTHDGSVAGTAAQGLAGRPSADQRQSYLSTSTSETGYPAFRPPPSSAPSSGTRKSAAPPMFRPVNIIQHDDAGPSEPPPPPPEEEPETIELPPAYTNIRRDDVTPPVDSEGEGAGPSSSSPRAQAAQA
ncbi:hypothetical protein C8Q77DRAFT_1074934 [Trametes polyzona]|nr:hypothetical protein C8Q77DRAFT_1074934 [Trametes polyzona]